MLKASYCESEHCATVTRLPMRTPHYKGNRLHGLVSFPWAGVGRKVHGGWGGCFKEWGGGHEAFLSSFSTFVQMTNHLNIAPN